MLASLRDWINDRFGDAEYMIDFVPVASPYTLAEWDAKLHTAAERHGKPFKCAAAGIPHEVLSRPA